MGEPINGPAEVDCTLGPEAPSCTAQVDTCLDLGNGVGQTSWTMQACTIDPPLPTDPREPHHG